MGAAVVVGWVAAACSGGDAAHLGSGRECSSIQGPLQGQNLPEMSAVLFFKESLILYGPYTRLGRRGGGVGGRVLDLYGYLFAMSTLFGVL